MPHAEQTARTCLVRGDAIATRAMIRFVVGPDNAVVPDLEERLPGRGLWVSADREAIEAAASKRLFAKAAKTAAVAAPDLADRVAGLLRRRCLDRLGLARRAGQTIAGADRVRQALAAGKVKALIEARDGSEGERAKILAVAGDTPVIVCFTAGELADVFGRDAVSHAAIKHGGLADGLLRDSERLAAMQRPVGGVAAVQ